MTTQQQSNAEYLKELVARREQRQAIEQAAGPRPERKSAPAQKRTRTSNEYALGIVLLLAGAIGWLSGARYTLMGGAAALNLFLTWLGLPVTIPAPVGWAILLALPIGVLYSQVETRVWYQRNTVLMRSPLFWIGWLLIVGTDVGSTWLGVRQVAPDSWLLTKQLAANGWIALVWSMLLTFAPEWLMLGAKRFLRP